MKSPITSTFALALSLLACAQEPAGTQTPAGHPAAALAQPAAPVRVLVKFKNPAAIDAATFVQRLQALSPTPVRYVAAVFADTHVYILTPQPGQNTAQLHQQLSALPEIARVEFDSKAKGH